MIRFYELRGEKGTYVGHTKESLATRLTNHYNGHMLLDEKNKLRVAMTDTKKSEWNMLLLEEVSGNIASGTKMDGSPSTQFEHEPSTWITASLSSLCVAPKDKSRKDEGETTIAKRVADVPNGKWKWKWGGASTRSNRKWT
jgi:hypothetical protein